MNMSTIRFHPAAQKDDGPLLPTAFAEFEPLVAEWALPNERARAYKRIETPIEKLHAFHAATVGRLEEILDYFNTFPNDPAALPPDAKRLYQLTQMVMEASAPIDLQWPTPDIEDVFPMDRVRFHPPGI